MTNQTIRDVIDNATAEAVAWQLLHRACDGRPSLPAPRRLMTKQQVWRTALELAAIAADLIDPKTREAIQSEIGSIAEECRAKRNRAVVERSKLNRGARRRLERERQQLAAERRRLPGAGAQHLAVAGACSDCNGTADITLVDDGSDALAVSDIWHEDGCPAATGAVDWSPCHA
jgi:hypothetical protein